ncbi:MAG: substrate-binding domain-containing protein [Lachnospiraceae bacterium]|nr:substrate-binding domain-containing protein [Lachnospiraceae bacterium]
MLKKKLALFFAASMVVASVAGCGGGDSQQADAPAADAAADDAADDAAADDTADDAADDTADDAADDTADDAAADDSAASGELITVGIINNDPSESGYRTANDRDLKEHFTEENGYSASFSYSNKNDEQIAAAQKFIQDGVQYLLLSAADTSGWDTVLQDAQDNGINVILFDRVIDASEDLYAGSIVSDMNKEGQTAVDWLKNEGLEEYNIIHLQGVMGTAAQKGRSQAMIDAAEAEGWNIVTQQTAEWNAEKAQQIVQSVIDSGEKFNVIYAENDDMAKGAVAALDNANISHGVDKDVIIMGFDTNTWALEELKAGNWNYDGQCNPYQSKYIEQIIETLEKGEQPAEKTIVMDEKGLDARTITDADIEECGI